MTSMVMIYFINEAIWALLALWHSAFWDIEYIGWFSLHTTREGLITIGFKVDDANTVLSRLQQIQKQVGIICLAANLEFKKHQTRSKKTYCLVWYYYRISDLDGCGWQKSLILWRRKCWKFTTMLMTICVDA